LIALISILVGFTYPVIGQRSFKFKNYVLLDVIIVVITILLVAASLTPSVYIEHGLPAPRTMIIPSFIAVFGFAMGGWVTGSALSEISQAKMLQLAVSSLLLISFAFPLFTMMNVTGLVPIYSQRTQAWDVREAIIQKGLNDGLARVTVTGIDGAPVGGIRDFDPKGKKGYWITQCAADYYGIKLDAVLP
jgi:hypothetical protein